LQEGAGVQRNRSAPGTHQILAPKRLEKCEIRILSIRGDKGASLDGKVR
jgi:hypothetical protein